MSAAKPIVPELVTGTIYLSDRSTVKFRLDADEDAASISGASREKVMAVGGLVLALQDAFKLAVAAMANPVENEEEQAHGQAGGQE